MSEMSITNQAKKKPADKNVSQKAQPTLPSTDKAGSKFIEQLGKIPETGFKVTDKAFREVMKGVFKISDKLPEKYQIKW